MSWTDERIDMLKSLWEQGLTASQIAEDLGGVSRNAVIGKAHRLGLQSRPSPVKANELEAKPAPVSVADKPPVVATTATVARTPAAIAPAADEASTPPSPRPVASPRVVEADVPPAVRPIPATHLNTPYAPPPSAPTGQQLRSIGPGGFLRQGPGDQLPPATPAPPRRLVPAKPSAEMAGKTSLLDLNERICKWPLGHPGEPDFHFCGDKVNPGFPYCVTHCGHAYQAQMPRRDRRVPPPLPFGGPRVR
jgi:GcrA cell cycle regulator